MSFLQVSLCAFLYDKSPSMLLIHGKVQLFSLAKIFVLKDFLKQSKMNKKTLKCKYLPTSQKLYIGLFRINIKSSYIYQNSHRTHHYICHSEPLAPFLQQCPQNILLLSNDG